MKTWLWLGISAFTTWQAAAQGTVNFANAAAGVNARVVLADGGAIAEGPQWQAELLLVTLDGSSQRVGAPVPLQSADLAGYFFGGSMVVPGIGAGSDATLRVRAFDTIGKAEVFSNPVKVTLGGGKMPPPNLVGLGSWGIHAVTSELKIALTPGSVTLSWSKDLTNAALEFSDSLTRPNWTSATETPQEDGSILRVTVPVALSERYYRLRLR